MTTPNFVERRKCPCCESSRLTTLYENQFDRSPIKEYLEHFYSPQGGIEFNYLEGAVYALLKCQKCDLIFQRDILNDDLMERLYEHWIDPSKAMLRHMEGDFPELYGAHVQEIMRIIAYFGRPPSSLQFLDFGMGWSGWALMAKGFGCEAYGAELSSKRIEYAKSKGLQVITKGMPALKFDFINTEQVFEHLPNPLETLLELKQSLKPGGILKISVPPGRDIERRLKNMDWKAPLGSRNSLNPVAPLEHINCFPRSALIKMAHLAGLREVEIPLKVQYRHLVKCGGIIEFVKNALMPIYRATLKRSNYIFFLPVTTSPKLLGAGRDE
jgi:SAM-dependent methyltransferase